MPELGVGLVGAGEVTARHHLPALKGAAGLKVWALADLDRPRAEALARRFQIPRVYQSLEQMLQDPQVDAVGICTPPDQHVDQARSALQAGRHVLVEKPLSLDCQAARSLVEWAAEQPWVAALGFPLRHHPFTQQALALLRQGSLGRLESLESQFWAPPPSPQSWRARPGGGGCPLWDLAVHHVDLWRFFCDQDPVAWEGQGDSLQWQVQAEFPQGVRCRGQFAVGNNPLHRVEMRGSRRRLSWSFYGYAGFRGLHWGQRLLCGLRVLRGWPHDPVQQAFRQQWLNFAESVSAGSRPRASLQDGLKAVEILSGLSHS